MQNRSVSIRRLQRGAASYTELRSRLRDLNSRPTVYEVTPHARDGVQPDDADRGSSPVLSTMVSKRGRRSSAGENAALHNTPPREARGKLDPMVAGNLRNAIEALNGGDLEAARAILLAPFSTTAPEARPRATRPAIENRFSIELKAVPPRRSPVGKRRPCHASRRRSSIATRLALPAADALGPARPVQHVRRAKRRSRYRSRRLSARVCAACASAAGAAPWARASRRAALSSPSAQVATRREIARALGASPPGQLRP